MNDRRRFLNCLSFGDMDRPPLWEWGFREDTTARWHTECLPATVPGEIGWTEYFGFDRDGGYADGSMAD